MDENKARRDAEIERLCDIATAQENGRLAEGGPGPGDHVPAENLIFHDQGAYVDRRQPQPIALGAGEAPYRDEYRELLEQMAERPATCARLEGIEEPEVVLGTTHTAARKDEIMRVVNQIRARASQHQGQALTDVGYLLEVIDAFESGRL